MLDRGGTINIKKRHRKHRKIYFSRGY